MPITEGYLAQLAKVESGDNPLAQNPKSSAKGRYQFVSATAQQYGLNAEFGTPEYEAQEREAVVKFTQDNYNHLKSTLGREPTQGELYLAHQQGAGGAEKVLKNPDAKAVDVLGEEAVVNNGGSPEMTAAEFAQKWTSKFDQQDAMSAPIKMVNLYELMGDTQPTEAAKPTQKPAVNLYELMGNAEPAPEGDFVVSKDKFGDTSRQNIDTKSGAPSYVRATIGSIQEANDKLESLRQFYPDAQPYGDGTNYIYTDPETNRPTLYNPKGFDAGDVASLTKEAAQAVGGAFGAATGAAFSLPTTAGLGVIPFAAAGGGVGTALAGSAFDRLVDLAGIRVDTRTQGQKAMAFGGDVLLGATGEAAGRLIAPAVKGILGGGKKTAADAVALFKQFGITPTAAAVTGSRSTATIQSGLEQYPLTAEVMQQQAEKVVGEVQGAVSKVVASYGKPSTVQGTGEVIQKAAIAAAERFGFRQEQLYTQAYDIIGEGMRIPVASVETLHNELLGQIARAPESLTPKLGKAMTALKGVMADAADGGIDFAALRQIRTAIGKDLDNVFFSSGAENAALKQVYGAISEDLANAAKSVSPEAAKAITKADRYTRAFMNTQKETLEKIINLKAEERAYNFAIGGAQYGSSSLNKLKGAFKPDEWDQVSATVLNNLGKAQAGVQNAAGDEFSMATFLTNWNKLSPEAKDVLFNTKGHKQAYQALNQLTEVIEKVKDASKTANTSNTGGVVGGIFLYSTLTSALGSFLSGNIVSGGAQIAGGVVAPYTAAKLLTNPKFVTWLSEPVTQGVSSLPAHIARLVAIAKDNPEIEPEVQEYIKALDDSTR